MSDENGIEKSKNQDVDVDEVLVLRKRVTDLEKTVSEQGSQMAILQATVADLLRRLASLEANRTMTTPNSPSRPRLPSRTQSQSSYSLAQSLSNRTPSRMSSSLYEANSTSTLSIATTASNTGRVNISMGRSPRGSPMRKWLSHVDVGQKNASNEGIRTPPRLISPSCSTSSRGSIVRNTSFSRVRRTHQKAEIDNDEGIMTINIEGRRVKIPIPSDFDEEKGTLAKNDIALDRIYGMRTRDSRQSVLYAPTGEFVYFAGNVVVLFDVETNRQRFYEKHTAEVRCVALHPNGHLIASGQSSLHGVGVLHEHKSPITSSNQLEQKLESEMTQAHVRVWHAVTLNTVAVIGSLDFTFERGISNIAFSHADGGRLLAVVDQGLNHRLSVWEWNQKKKLSNTKAGNDTTFGCLFHPSNNSLILVYGKGFLSLWRLTQDQILMQMPFEFKGRNRPKTVLSACFTAAGDLATGDSNGSITIWNIATASIATQGHDIHRGGVYCLYLSRTGSLVSVGKGEIIESDSLDLARKKKPLMLPDDIGLPRCIVESGNSFALAASANSLLFGSFETGLKPIISACAGSTIFCKSVDEHKLLIVASNGQTTMWNENEMDWTINFMEGMTHWVGEQSISCCSLSTNGLLAFGFSPNGWAVWDISTKQAIFDGSDDTQSLSVISFSSSGNWVAMGTKDSGIVVYKVERSRRPVLASAINNLPAVVSSIDFSTNDEQIRINTVDGHLMFYMISGTQLSFDAVRNTEWSTCSCRVSQEAGLGTHVTQDVTCVSSQDDLVAIGRSSGKIRVYSSPIKYQESPYLNALCGQGAVRSLVVSNSNLVCAIADETAVFQWKLV